MADADAVGERLRGPGLQVAPLLERVDEGPRASACTPSMRGKRRMKPSAFISCRPFQVPAIVQPSPTDTATQSGTSAPSCSAISSPQVFLPSTRQGFTAALRLYQP